jgi:hypothetical protein
MVDPDHGVIFTAVGRNAKWKVPLENAKYIQSPKRGNTGSATPTCLDEAMQRRKLPSESWFDPSDKHPVFNIELPIVAI